LIWSRLPNLSNVVGAINIITDSDIGLGFSSRRVTVSTSGLIPKLSQLGRETTVNLAISLNATDNKTRDMLDTSLIDLPKILQEYGHKDREGYDAEVRVA
jgi:hypothetical protein